MYEVYTLKGKKMKSDVIMTRQQADEWIAHLENIFPVVRLLDAEDIKKRTIELLEMVGIANSEGVYAMFPHELSGGMRQRVALIRTLAINPDILLLDEPFTGLDDKNREIVQQEIKEYARKKPVVLVSHVEEDLEIADKKIEL